ncbi:YycH family regulatory protein [Cohnella ginsengisoli]|uniref:YycH family regulatory protein n=1 Tax=Cohnella ginsengisoli TaxID=425004 RepID=A0A9X4KMW2_9BACL|nr:two-component system activity regulator YycH [Cohnella ginsengisoli]MDG0795222.1 YycH family regulatory protein [Cohnella ginsengisoli]
MIDKVKSVALALLVVLSLVQSYFLAYSMPNLETQVKTEQDYVKTEELGPEEKVENLIFPESLVIHMGQDKHTVFYPQDTFYGMVLDKLSSREFKGFQRAEASAIDWEQVRKQDEGIEIRFGRDIPFSMLQRAFKGIDGEALLAEGAVDRIWIFARPDSGVVRSFFLDADGTQVYEAAQVDLTAQDVEQSVGFGQYWKPFSYWANGVYVPDQSLALSRVAVSFTKYTADQMQRNLFNDPTTTRMIQDSQDGAQIYRDTKRGLKIEQGGGWLSYKDPVARAEGRDDPAENITSAVQFVNQHGGWNGAFRLTQAPGSDESNDADPSIRFQQYYGDVPLLSEGEFRFGYMQLAVQQGVVSSYERSLLVLGDKVGKAQPYSLISGNQLLVKIRQAAGGQQVESLFPAYRTTLAQDKLVLEPVWAIRTSSGEVRFAS